jgi:hypothetical protein
MRPLTLSSCVELCLLNCAKHDKQWTGGCDQSLVLGSTTQAPAPTAYDSWHGVLLLYQFVKLNNAFQFVTGRLAIRPPACQAFARITPPGRVPHV